MRFARTALGLLLTLIGLVVGIAGAAAAFWLVGPDNTISTGGRSLTSAGLAVVTAPDLLDRHGPTLRVSVTGSKPVFVGIAQDLDVTDYLNGAAHTRVIRYDVPSTISTQTMRGFEHKLTPPGDLDWWVAKSGGNGNQSIAWPMQDGRYSVVVMNADGTPAVDANVSFGIELHRSFGISLLILGAGIAALALGITLAFRRSPDEPVVPASTAISLTTSTPTTIPTATALSTTTGTETTLGMTAGASTPVRGVSPFAPVDDVPAYRAPEVRSVPDEATERLAVISQPRPTSAAQLQTEAPVRPARPSRPIPGVQPLRSAPMLMTPAAVAKAKSRAALPPTSAPTTPTTATTTAQPSASTPSASAPSSSTPPAPTPLASTPPAPTPPAFAPSASTPPAPTPPASALAGSTPTAPTPSASTAPVETLPLVESPEFTKSDEAVKRTAALLASGALLLTATSCGLMPPKNNLTVPDRRPAVTIADAKAVVTKYSELNNKANQTRDNKLAATIEAEPTLAQTLAGYQIGRKLDAAGKTLEKPFTFTDPVVGAPEFTAYPMRFVVTTGVSGSTDTRQLGVWERQSAGAPWLLTHSVYPGRSIDLPAMEGVRTPSRADVASLATHPAAVAPTLAAYLTGGPKAPEAKLFTASPGMAKLLEQRAKSKHADAAEPYIAAVTDTYKPTGTPVTFMTADGEGLVFLALTEQYLQRVEPGSNAYWTSGEATAFSSKVKFTQTLHQDYLHQVALVIPARTTGGPVRILSMDGQLTGAGGS
ncbi:hypothetical protein ACFCV3_26280 [Kribbella sp. NPDC056345]|uniref:hypothetical protein n=1 Tax=Kribbella sp. NPDC056345 TaxID=3345789 RepID=UPI0035DF7791